MKLKNLILALVVSTSVATAGKVDQASTSLFSKVVTNNSPVVPNSTPDSSVLIDFGVLVAESWETQGDPLNVIGNCVMGGSVTGVEWTGVTIDTVGASWLSEATILFSDSAGGGGINLSLGVGDNMAGVATYSSGAIVDLTDNGLPDIVALADGLLPIEFFDSFNDNVGAIDANFTAGTLEIWGIGLTPNPACQFISVAFAAPTPVPSLNLYALVALFLTLLVVGYKRSRA